MADQLLPLARRDNLVVRELDEEVLIYDLKTHKAVCLNRAAALVWQGCDGRTDAAGLARLLKDEIDAPLAEEAVWMALARLGRENLLVERVRRERKASGLSRRELLRRVGYAAAASVPLVTSMLAPTPAQAASCLPSGATCTAGAECCSGVCTGGTCVG